jgi:hypothetical protein
MTGAPLEHSHIGARFERPQIRRGLKLQNLRAESTILYWVEYLCQCPFHLPKALDQTDDVLLRPPRRVLVLRVKWSMVAGLRPSLRTCGLM